MWRVWALGGVAAVVLCVGCGRWADDSACGDQGCFFTEDEWARVQSLANVTRTPPRPDPSNAYLPIVGWATRALAPTAYDDPDGTLVAEPAADPVVHLGWLLYHETALSGSVTDKDTMGLYAPTTRPVTACKQIGVSCATCHDPRHAGADITSVPSTVSIGAGWYDVNGQQTLNAARFPILYWNGRTDTLWAQAAQVMESGVSMDGYRMKTFWVVQQPQYWAQYAAVFPASAAAVVELAARVPTPPGTAADLAYSSTADYKAQYDTYVKVSPADKLTVDRVLVNVAKAIAAYEWVLSSDGSAFDQFAAGVPAAAAGFSPAAERGLKLFIGRASCIDCHDTPLFSDGEFHDIGIAQQGPHVPTQAQCSDTSPTSPCDCVTPGGAGPGTLKSCLPIGAYAGQEKLAASPEFGLASAAYNDNFAATGLPPPARPAPDPRWIGAWRTPSLRDVALTAPYMHDGSLATLSDVVWHYDQGGSEGNAVGSSELAPLFLSAQDRDDLVAFLRTLTGTPGPAGLVEPPDPSLLIGTPATCTPPAVPAPEVGP